MAHFTLEELCHGIIPTKEQETNLKDLISKLHHIFEYYKDPIIVNRGLRTEMQNETVGGVKNSPHLTGEAVDLDDKDFKVSIYLLNNLELLDRFGLYMENPFCTCSKDKMKNVNGKTYMNNWIHLQSRKASKTVFLP